MPEGLDNEQPPADNSDLLAVMDDVEMADAMRRAVARVNTTRARTRSRLTNMQLLVAGVILPEEAGPDFSAIPGGSVRMKLDGGSFAEFPLHSY